MPSVPRPATTRAIGLCLSAAMLVTAAAAAGDAPTGPTSPGELRLQADAAAAFETTGQVEWLPSGVKISSGGTVRRSTEVWPLATLSGTWTLSVAGQAGKPASASIVFEIQGGQRITAVLERAESKGTPSAELRIVRFQPPGPLEIFGRGKTTVLRRHRVDADGLDGPWSFDFRYGELAARRGGKEVLAAYGEIIPLALQSVSIHATNASLDLGEGGLAVPDTARIPTPTPEQERELTRRQREMLLAGVSGAILDSVRIQEGNLAFYVQINGGRDDVASATMSSTIGSLYLFFGEQSRARSALERAWSVRERILGPLHPETAATHVALARFHQNVGDETALWHWSRALASYRRLGLETDDAAIALEESASLCRELGDLDRARAALEEAIPIRRRLLGPEVSRGALVKDLMELGDVDRDAKREQAARGWYEEAAAIARSERDKPTRPQESPAWAWSLVLAKLERRLGSPEKAEALLLELAKSKSPAAAEPFVRSALLDLYQEKGQTEAAVREAAAIERDVANDGRTTNPAFLESKRSYELGRLLTIQGDLAAALPHFQKALDIDVARAGELLDVLSEAEAMRHIRVAWRQRDGALEALRTSPESNARAAWGIVWSTRGLASRALAARRLTGDSRPELVDARRRLVDARRSLAAAAVADNPKARARLDELTRAREQCERKLSELSREFRQSQELREASPDDLAMRLPRGTAVIDFVQTTVAGGDKSVYDAFVIRAGEPTVSWVPLGDAGPIDADVAAWRAALRLPQEFDRQTAAAARVRARVWNPIEGRLEGSTTVIVIPDQQLCGIPWGALPGARPGSYLIESLAIATAQHGQQICDLLTREPATGDGALLVGDLDYGISPRQAAERAEGSQGPWPRVPYTKLEIEEIGAVLPASARVLTGSDATESALRDALPGRRYVHLATHGYYDGPQAPGPGSAGRRGASTTSRNPLLHAALVVSGANSADRSDPSLALARNDGLLLAEELVEIDLTAAELVVLSACSTSLGETIAGEGVLGLQRTFNAAGARTVVASLWDVDDPATRALMRAFYSHLLTPTPRPGKLDALRRAQLEMIRGYDPVQGEVRGVGGTRPYKVAPLPAGRPLPPFYWAAFTLSGDWR